MIRCPNQVHQKIWEMGISEGIYNLLTLRFEKVTPTIEAVTCNSVISHDYKNIGVLY